MDGLRYYWSQFVRGMKPSEETEGYGRHEYQATHPFGGPSTRTAIKSFDAEGDHLSIARVVGGLPVYVRLGKDSNPWIRVRAGMVLSRPFRRFTFSLGNDQGSSLGAQHAEEVRVLAFTSFGPLFAQFPPKEYGFRRSPLMLYDLTATTTRSDLSDIVLGTALTSADASNTGGLYGGTLVIMNTDVANDLYLVNQVAASPDPTIGKRGFGPLRPGQSVALKLEDLPFRFATATDAAALGVFTTVGTCKFSVMLSSGESESSEGFLPFDHSPSLRT